MKKDGADRDKLLNEAKQDISLTKRLYPELGGELFVPKYDGLLKKIQTALGETAVGLEALSDPKTPEGVADEKR